MKYLLVLLSFLFVSQGYSNEIDAYSFNDSLKRENRELRREVQQLKKRVRDLEENAFHVSTSKRWGCYLDDMSAGGLYGTGYTQAEAKGMVLEKCNDRNGVCFETRVKCNKS